MIESPPPTALPRDRAWNELERRLRAFTGKRVPMADVDDVVQEAFLRIQAGLPTLRERQRFGPWVYQVARSAIVDHLRRSARHSDRVEGGGGAESAFLPLEADSSAVEQEVALYAAFFVSLLPSPYREALTLTELQGLTQKEAADMLGVSLSGMKSRVQRGREKLRAVLEACCDIALDARGRVVGCEPRSGKQPDGCCD